MTARRLSLHGLVVEVEDRLPGRPSAELLAPFPQGPPGAVVVLRLALVSAIDPRPLPAGRPLFFHGTVRAVEVDGATVLGDGRSTIAVSADGRDVSGQIHAGSLTDPRAFANAFLLLALLVALRRHGLYHLHAAALRAPSGQVLLVAGNGGSGKSTVALALASAGFDFVGDDTVLLARREGRPALLALPRPFHVGERTAAAFPELAPHLGAPYALTGKRFLDAERAFGRRCRREVGAPGTILFPSIAEEPATRVEPIGAADALGRLVESSALLVVDRMPGVEEQLGLLKELADGSRGYALLLGRDLLADPRAWARSAGAFT